MSSKDFIPTLDVRHFVAGSPSQRAAFVEALGGAYTNTGFVVLEGHSVSAEMQNLAYQKIGDFFALPSATKRSFEVPGIGGARGYTSFGKEHAKDSPLGDLKEFFQVGMELPPGHPMEKHYPKNVSVPQIPGFDDTLRSLYQELLGLGTHVLRAIALFLKEDEFYFDRYVKHGNSILRPIHYPPLRGEEDPNAVRSAAHEDINLITLLIGASSPGLQVQSKSGSWIEVTTKAHEIVVNVGDMLQRLTNHRLKSTTHRVVNPPRENSTSTRFSIPFFLHPESTMSLAALTSCVPAGTKALEEPISAGDYLNQRLREIGLL
jgi:isopenicillin N synthase-like dioxygenase